MNARPALHPSAQALAAFVQGKLDDASAESVIRHLDGCLDCREAAAAQSGDDFLDRLRAAHGLSGTPMPEKSLPDISCGAGPVGSGSISQTEAPKPPANLPPELTRHPQYEVLRELGHGGMGVVYLARHRMSGRREVLKVMNREMLRRPGSKERFLREIQSAALLKHDYVVQMYTATEVGDLMVLVMEYVEGQDLQASVESGPLSVALACRYVHQVALALQHASDRGMVHRDIKPQNLILTREGGKPVVKVLDFGLAKVKSEKRADADLTGEGRMLGTPQYMAPEQIRDAAHADIRADIYSLGCTLYCLLTGAPPFHDRQGLFGILQAHQSVDARPVNLVRPDVPPELAAVVAKMMAKDVSKRYQRPIEVAQAVAPFINPRSSSQARPAALKMAPGSTAPPPVAVPVSPGVWETRTDGGGTSTTPPGDAVPPLQKAKKSRKTTPGPVAWYRRWRVLAAAGAAVLALGLLTWQVAAVIFKAKVKTAEGEVYIVLEIDQPGAEVFVDGNKVTVHVPGDNKSVEIKVVPGLHKLRISKDGFVAVTKEIELTTGKAPPIKVKLLPAIAAEQRKSRVSAPFFNGEDLAGWEGLPGYWEVKPGYWDVKNVAIVGRPPRGRPAHTFLVSRRKYRDFDLKFEVRRLDGVGNSGVQFRSQMKDPDRYTVVGPQVEIDSINFHFPPGSLVTEPTADPLKVLPSPDIVAELRKTYADDGFNAFHIRCVGKHVTIHVNGITTVDGDFDSLPEEGVIAWQLHGRMAPKEVLFRNIQFIDLSAAAGAEGWVTLFNGKDLSGWKRHPAQLGNWRVEGGVLKGTGPDTSHLYTEHGDYNNFHLRTECRINAGGNSGVLFRCSSAPAWPDNRPTWPLGYEAQIYHSDKAAEPQTGSLYAGPAGAVARVAESPAAPGQWFKLEVIARGDQITIQVDGRTTVNYYSDDPNRFPRGHIALQVMGPNRTEVEFRKIEIKELK